ncbi:CoA transferase [Burkholderia aenigmatica]|uniref:CoA transferase n=2 Tax=Burkholderia aenigmatica TaxID=2015348 RepID=A0A228J2Q0_9BURK|nr:CoA transferase [Burkholderia aenigmatica]OXI49083.1 CoA transferase [Burkholderia aenigmatica]
MMRNTEPIGHLPLAGVKVIELAQIMAGPTCGVMLADLGADVYKIEKFPAGDDARSYRRGNEGGLPPSFMMLNRGKHSVGLDLKSTDGRAVLLRLIARADVLTENFRAGVMERLDLGYDTLRAINPALIYCAISGYGRQGPLADKGGFDLILQAFSGLISVTGEPGRPPVKPGVSIADVNAGILAAFGILAAYVHRLKTGIGQRVDTSLLQASLQQLYWYAAAYFATGAVGKPSGTAHPLIAPYQVYRCADGDIAVGGANQANWERIAELLGHPEWMTDSRFESPQQRLRHRGELEVLINAVLADASVDHWVARFDRMGIPAGPVQSVAQALEHEQSRRVGMVREVDAPGGGTTRTLGLPVLLGGHSHVASRAAPRVGADTESVLRDFGFHADEIQHLIDKKVVFQCEPESHSPTD